jgi:hypothetical protein
MLNSPLVTPKTTDRLVREPASDWASSTLDALDPISSQDQFPSNPTTPGLQIPGAFPGPYPKAIVVQQDIQYVKDTALYALQTAKSYAPASVGDVKRLIENTGETVGGYLPQSVAAYLPHHTTTDDSLPSDTTSQDVRSTTLSEEGTNAVHQSTNVLLPSEEISQNVHPKSSGGAGILPGFQTAKSYAPASVGDVKLLIENTGETVGGYLPQSVAAYLPHHTTTDDSLPSDTTSQDVRSTTLSEEGTNAVHNVSLPSEEISHNVHPESSGGAGILPVTEKSSTGGVGALPGDKEEVGVALLPEERKSVGASTDPSTALLPSTEAQDRNASQYTLPATDSPLPVNGTNASSTNASHPTIPNTSARMVPLANDGFKSNGIPSSEGFQQGLDQEQSSPTKKSVDEQRNLEQGQSDLGTAGHGAVAEAAVMNSSSHAEHGTVRKKPGFMDKLKGEVKVISGKLSHKESKVEEGRRMMGRN